MGVRGRFPFRVGTTSYILPADILTNVRHLAGMVDDIELLVFESDTMAELPDAATLAELNAIALAASLSYTVHLPLDINLGHPHAAVRERSVGKCARTIERMSVVNPVAWILHCDRRLPEEKALPDAAWAEHCAQSLRMLIAGGVVPGTVCVETLDGNFPLLEQIIRDAGVSVCLDIGHLLLYGLDFPWYLDHYAACARVMHLHGVIDGKDHRAISGIPGPDLNKVVATASEGTGCVVTMEVFNQGDLDASLRIMEELSVCHG